MSPSLSLKELLVYHNIDRQIFLRLLVRLFREPAESLIAMALWLWLEETGHPNIISKMVVLSDSILNRLADEAALCVRFLESGNERKLLALPKGGMPITAGVTGKETSVEFFYHNKFTTILGVKRVLNSVCARIFTDILYCVSESKSKSKALAVPGFPHSLFGNVCFAFGRPENVPKGGMWGWSWAREVAADERTMFLTFSRGFPVTETEVKEVFTRLLGEECVERVEMQGNLEAGEQPLFARMVVTSISVVDKLLVGRTIAKFWINGKHIWARKYERRD